jgi:hypothetical protein
MTSPSDVSLGRAGLGHVMDDVERVLGQEEVEQFDRLRDAYDPRVSDSLTRMVAAFKRIHSLGYDAYFQRRASMPPFIATRTLLADMWTDGYQLARSDAVAMRCNCTCIRGYVWGDGYANCPRRLDSRSWKQPYQL